MGIASHGHPYLLSLHPPQISLSGVIFVDKMLEINLNRNYLLDNLLEINLDMSYFSDTTLAIKMERKERRNHVSVDRESNGIRRKDKRT